MWTQEMFGVEKPIIALLHLDALPGDPGYCGSMDTVLEHARQDLVALQNGGVDGILFANEFSLPYQPVADVAVISAMAYIIGALRPLIRVPYGVNVVKNPIATIDLAAADHALKGIALHFRIVIVNDHNIIASAAQLALKLIEDMRKHQVFAQAVKVERKKHPDRIRFAGFETARLRIEHKTVFLRLLFNIDFRFFAYGRTTVKRPRNGRLRYADQFCKFPRSHQAKPLLPFFR